MIVNLMYLNKRVTKRKEFKKFASLYGDTGCKYNFERMVSKAIVSEGRDVFVQLDVERAIVMVTDDPLVQLPEKGKFELHNAVELDLKGNVFVQKQKRSQRKFYSLSFLLGKTVSDIRASTDKEVFLLIPVKGSEEYYAWGIVGLERMIFFLFNPIFRGFSLPGNRIKAIERFFRVFFALASVFLNLWFATYCYTHSWLYSSTFNFADIIHIVSGAISLILGGIVVKNNFTQKRSHLDVWYLFVAILIFGFVTPTGIIDPAKRFDNGMWIVCSQDDYSQATNSLLPLPNLPMYIKYIERIRNKEVTAMKWIHAYHLHLDTELQIVKAFDYDKKDEILTGYIGHYEDIISKIMSEVKLEDKNGIIGYVLRLIGNSRVMQDVISKRYDDASARLLLSKLTEFTNAQCSN